MPPLAPYFDQLQRRTQLLWVWALLTPILYLTLAWAFQSWGWVITAPAAPHAWDTPTARLLAGGLAGAMLATLGWFRWQRPRLARRLADRPAEVARLWTRYFYIMATLSDSLAFLGLLCFLVSAHTLALLGGGAAAYIGYALCYPRRNELAGLTWQGDVADQD
jgi:hypothetical protein